MSEPTRGTNLPDLALSSVPAASSAIELLTISGHSSVLVGIDVPMPRIEVLVFAVPDFRHADWASLVVAFEGVAWDSSLPYNDPDVAVANLC